MELLLYIVVAIFIFWIFNRNFTSIKNSQSAQDVPKEQKQKEHILKALTFTKQIHQELEQNEAMKRAWQLRYGTMQLKEIDMLSGVAFEQFLKGLFKKMGYEVETTSASGDFGADLILTNQDERIAIQAKRWQGTVGVASVQEALSGKSYYQCNSAWVVTTSNFTTQSIQLAKKAEVRLINRDELATLVSQYIKSADS